MARRQGDGATPAGGTRTCPENWRRAGRCRLSMRQKVSVRAGSMHGQFCFADSDVAAEVPKVPVDTGSIGVL